MTVPGKPRTQPSEVSSGTTLRLSVEQPAETNRPVIMEISVAELAHLQNRLVSLPVIEQAKGILMGHYRIGPDTAFTVLCRWSQTTNIKLRVIAEALTVGVEGHPTPHSSPEEILFQVLEVKGDRLLLEPPRPALDSD